jgi:hypothetical protein
LNTAIIGLANTSARFHCVFRLSFVAVFVVTRVSAGDMSKSGSSIQLYCWYVSQCRWQPEAAIATLLRCHTRVSNLGHRLTSLLCVCSADVVLCIRVKSALVMQILRLAFGARCSRTCAAADKSGSVSAFCNMPLNSTPSHLTAFVGRCPAKITMSCRSSHRSCRATRWQKL